MIRKIEVAAGAVKITAVIDSKDTGLTRDEVERARDSLADMLQASAATVRHFEMPRNRVRVR